MQREASAGAKPPHVTALRLVGRGAELAREHVVAPFGATFSADATAYAVALAPSEATDMASVAQALPAPEELTEGTLVFVLPALPKARSLARRLFAAFGRGRVLTREVRSTALVARGYVGVSAGVDPASRTDLVWGYAPGGAPGA